MALSAPMHKTGMVAYRTSLEGERALLPDTQEVPVSAGSIVIAHGSNHRWSNRSATPAVVAIASHCAR